MTGSGLPRAAMVRAHFWQVPAGPRRADQVQPAVAAGQAASRGWGWSRRPQLTRSPPLLRLAGSHGRAVIAPSAAVVLVTGPVFLPEMRLTSGPWC
jgi:hypothetical protein